MEKRSTLPPASAILMTAARPARPPPTTMILGAAISNLPILFRGLSSGVSDHGSVVRDEFSVSAPVAVDPSCQWHDVGRVLVLRADEGPDARQAHEQKHETQRGADIAEALAGDGAGGDAPLSGEEPDAV